MHGGPSPGAPKGNQNAFKHGRYSALSVQERRRVAALIREMRETAAAPKSPLQFSGIMAQTPQVVARFSQIEG
jgi:hypothetical protein